MLGSSLPPVVSRWFAKCRHRRAWNGGASGCASSPGGSWALLQSGLPMRSSLLLRAEIASSSVPSFGGPREVPAPASEGGSSRRQRGAMPGRRQGAPERSRRASRRVRRAGLRPVSEHRWMTFCRRMAGLGAARASSERQRLWMPSGQCRLRRSLECPVEPGAILGGFPGRALSRSCCHLAEPSACSGTASCASCWQTQGQEASKPSRAQRGPAMALVTE